MQNDQTIWIQKKLNLAAYRRGFHLITQQVIDALPQIQQIETGLLHVFIQHTSASLTINENADPDVRVDMENGRQPYCARKSSLRPHVGRSGRHARTRQEFTHGCIRFSPTLRWQAVFGNMARHLPVRTPRSSWRAVAGPDGHGQSIIAGTTQAFFCALCDRSNQ